MNRRVAQGFDFLSPVYDRLARWMIGEDIVTSQLHFIPRFKYCNRLLILGGGSGWWLAHLCACCPELEIDYVDTSSGMIGLAKKMVNGNKRITFIHGTEDDISDNRYDAVITNFYLDMFDEKRLKYVVEKVKRSLSDQALWVATDFINEKFIHAARLWIMYRFFRIVTGIQARRLPDWHVQIRNAGFEVLETQNFKNGFIISNLYRLILS